MLDRNRISLSLFALALCALLTVFGCGSDDDDGDGNGGGGGGGGATCQSACQSIADKCNGGDDSELQACIDDCNANNYDASLLQCVTDAATCDAMQNCGGGGGGGGGGGSLTCSQIWSCISNCQDQACADACYADGSASGQQNFQALVSCLDTNGCFDAATDAEAQQCMETNCSAEAAACN